MSQTELTAKAETLLAQLPDTRIAAEDELTSSLAERIYALHKQGKTQTEIAHTLGCAQSTVSRHLAKLIDNRELAKLVTHNSALDIAEATIAGAIKAAQKGRADAGLELLDRLGVAEKRVTQGSGNSQVNIVIGMPGMPAGDAPILSVSPLPFAPECSETGQAK